VTLVPGAPMSVTAEREGARRYWYDVPPT